MVISNIAANRYNSELAWAKVSPSEVIIFVGRGETSALLELMEEFDGSEDDCVEEFDLDPPVASASSGRRPPAAMMTLSDNWHTR